MTITTAENLTEKQKTEILALWNEEYPKALSLTGLPAFEDYLKGLAGKYHLLLTNEKGAIMGWLIYFMRDGEQCFAMLLHSALQGKGYGSKLLTAAKQHTTELNGWVIDNDEQPKQNGSPYQSPVGFYQKNGFEILPDVQSIKKNIKGIKVRWRR